MKKRNEKKEKKGLFFKLFKKEPKIEATSEELKHLEELKEKIRNVKTIEELEALEDELIALGLISPGEIKKLKNKKKGRVEFEYFQERVRVSLDIINKTIEVGRSYRQAERQREEKELIQNRDDRLYGNEGQKNKEKDKTLGEHSRSSGGRTRGDR